MAFLAAGSPAAQPGPRLDAIADRPFGVLVLGEGGDREWREAIGDLKKRASGRYPLEFAPGLADRAEMQRSLDSLERQRVKAIVLVPLLVSSYGETMDQVRYLLGIREKPPKPSLKAPPEPRLKSRVPLVLAKALDDHPLFVELLAMRARALSLKPAKEALLLVGQAPDSKDSEKEWLEATGALAELVRQKAGLAATRACALRPGLRQSEREASEASLRRLVKDLRRSYGKVIIVPLALTSSVESALRLRGAVEGLFTRYDGRAILPDARISQWVEQSAMAAAKLPDMRLFKDAARAGLMPPGLSQQPLARPAMEPLPPLPRPGEQKHE